MILEFSSRMLGQHLDVHSLPEEPGFFRDGRAFFGKTNFPLPLRSRDWLGGALERRRTGAIQFLRGRDGAGGGHARAGMKSPPAGTIGRFALGKLIRMPRWPAKLWRRRRRRGAGVRVSLQESDGTKSSPTWLMSGKAVRLFSSARSFGWVWLKLQPIPFSFG